MDVSNEEQKKSDRLLAETRADLLKRQLSNAENYDKAILSLSTASLGFSVGFLKDFVPIAIAKYPWILYGSWITLLLAVVATVLSYYFSQHAIVQQLERAEEYYNRGSDETPSRTTSAKFTDWINWSSGALFIIGIVCTTLFVFLNIEGASSMSADKKSQPDQRQKRQDAAPIPQLQQRPKPQPITPPTPSSPPPDQSTGSNEKP